MNLEPAFSTRWLELLKEITPSLWRVLLVNAGNVGNGARLLVIEAAPSFAVQVSSAVSVRRRESETTH
jgi:hypothetical protein